MRDADYATTYQGSKKILMIGADERYLLTDSGSFFSTGNHPVETLLPMYHLDKAGFAFDVATVSGNPVKFEFWAMPSEDETVKGFFDKYHPQFKQRFRLSSVLAQGLEQYAAIFVPGGHGALIGLPDSRDVGAVLEWARPPTTGRHLPLCHGPGRIPRGWPTATSTGAYKICALPRRARCADPRHRLHAGSPDLEVRRKAQGLGNRDRERWHLGRGAPGPATHHGRSPLVVNALGKLAAETLLAEVAA